jgi:hypothetical protein
MMPLRRGRPHHQVRDVSARHKKRRIQFGPVRKPPDRRSNESQTRRHRQDQREGGVNGCPAVARVESDRGHISSLCAVLDVIAPDIRPRKPVIRQFVKSQDVKLTPPAFVEQVVSVLDEIELDPCGHENSFVPATRQYFEEDDGLSQSWNAKTVFCNPPYSIADKFMRKAHAEWLSRSAGCIIVLVPARTHTKIFSEIAGDTDMFFLKNRMRFWSSERTPLPERAPFSSVVMIFGGDERVIERARTTWDGVFVPRRKID